MPISDTFLYLARRTRTNIKGLFYGKNGSVEPIPNGTSGQYLKMGTNGPEWGSGGGGIEYHAGLFHGKNNEVSGIADGTEGQFLKMGSSGPEWGSGGGVGYHTGIFYGKNNEVSGITDGYDGDYLKMTSSGPVWEDPQYLLTPTDLSLTAGSHTTIVWNASATIGKIVYLSLEVIGKTEGAAAGDVIFQKIPDPYKRTGSTHMTQILYTNQGFLTVDPGGYCYLPNGLAANTSVYINGFYLKA